jgi:hypothetical protein
VEIPPPLSQARPLAGKRFKGLMTSGLWGVDEGRTIIDLTAIA